MVAHLTRQPPLKATYRSSFPGAPDSDRVAISQRYDHYEERTHCVDYFVSVYGYNP